MIGKNILPFSFHEEMHARKDRATASGTAPHLRPNAVSEIEFIQLVNQIVQIIP